MAKERNGAAKVIAQDGTRLQVEHKGERLTVPMQGWRLSCEVRRSQSGGTLPYQAAVAPRGLQALVRRRGTL